MIVPSAVATRPLNRLLKMAVIAGVESAVRLHIVRGDDLDARDDKGQTPLMIATARNKASVCQLLLDAGVDVGAVWPCGRNALSIAISAGADDAAATIGGFLGSPARPNGADQLAAAPTFGDPVPGDRHKLPISAFLPEGDGPTPEHADIGRTGDPETKATEAAAPAGQSDVNSSYDITTTIQSEGVSAHCSGVSNFGTTKPSRLRCLANATTVGCRTLASFTRTQTLVAPMTPVEARKASTFDIADSRDASATLSSKSSITASAPLASAFVKRSGRSPGTYNAGSCRQHLWRSPCAGPGRRQQACLA